MALRGLVRLAGRAEFAAIERVEIVAGGVEPIGTAIADHDAGGARLNFNDECSGHDKPVARLAGRRLSGLKKSNGVRLKALWLQQQQDGRCIRLHTSTTRDTTLDHR